MSIPKDGVHRGHLILHDREGRVLAWSDPVDALAWDGEIEAIVDAITAKDQS